MLVAIIDAKEFISYVKTLDNCVGDYVYFRLHTSSLTFGDDSLYFHVYTTESEVLEPIDPPIVFKFPSSMLLKCKSTKSVKGDAYLFFEEDGTGGLYLESSNIGFQLDGEVIEDGFYTTKIDRESDKIILFPTHLSYLYTLSKLYKLSYLTDRFIIGFSDISCGFCTLPKITKEEFCYDFTLKSGLVSNLNKKASLFFTSLEDKIKLYDDPENPSFIFSAGNKTRLSKREELILQKLSQLEFCTYTLMGSGKTLFELVSNAKELCKATKIIVFTEDKSISYLDSETSTLVSFSSYSNALPYSLSFDCAHLAKVLDSYKKSKELYFGHISSQDLVFITDEEKAHYEVIIPYRTLIYDDNEDTGD